MKSRPHFPIKESLLLTLPLLILLGVASTHRDRGPFKLVVSEAKLTVLNQPAADGWIPHGHAVKVALSLGYTGNRPDWWGEAIDNELRINFVPRNQRDNGWNMGQYDSSTYDAATSCYLTHYEGEIPGDPQFIQGATCVIESKLKMHMSSSQVLAKVETSVPSRKMIGR